MYLEYILLGVIQGLTEFLPVSSSGHLVLCEHFLKVQSSDITLEITVHFATLLAVIVVFRDSIKELFSFFVKMEKGEFKESSEAKEGENFWGQIIVGTLVTGVTGLLFRNQVELLFEMPLVAGVCIGITGIILYLTRFRDPKTLRSLSSFGLWLGFCVGLSQALSLIPGISRSGATISVALLMGLQRNRAAELSFLLAIPAILSASALQLAEVQSIAPELIGPMIAAFISSFLVGYLALRLLLRFVKGGKFYLFSYYCWFLCVLSVILLLSGF